MKKPDERIILLVMRWILALVFIYAGLIKIYDPAGFAKNIDNYQVLPYFLVTVVAAILPWVEVICGLLLIVGRWMEGAAFLLLILNFVFVALIASALVRGLDIECGCFSTSGEGAHVGLVRIFEDLIFFGMALFVYLKRISKN